MVSNRREAWLEVRKTGLGASDAAVALGISPFKSRFELWCEKTGMSQPEDLGEIEAVEWGLRLEAPIAEAYAERTGRVVSRNEDYSLARHPEYDWMLATVDALQRDDARKENGILELKTTNAFSKKDWEAEPPLFYQVQLQHQLATLGADWGTLCVLIGGQQMLWFDQDRNENFIKSMIEREKEFWDLVVAKEMPEVDGSQATVDTLKRLYPTDDADPVVLPAEADEWDAKLCEVKELEKELKGQRTLLENKIKAAIGDAAAGILPGGGRYSWRNQDRKEYTVKASTIRVLRRHKK